MTPNQWTILERLEKGPAWIRSFQAVKPLLDDLIAKGLVERCRPHCGRANNLAKLTLAGCDALEVDPAYVPLEPPKKNGAARAPITFGEIRPDATKAVRKTCEAFLRGIRCGEIPSAIVARLADAEEVKRPAIWQRLIRGGVKPEYRPGKPLGRKAERIPEPLLFDIALDRDPCPRCGVRHDVGCRHSRAPLGMVL